MSKIGIVLDPHITDRHRCRSDNFLEVALKKLDYVASNNDYVIICGDFGAVWNNDKIDGEGTYTFSNGSYLAGKFKENKFVSGNYCVSDDTSTLYH